MKSMVKCLICGAIFEEGPSQCPVCGVGKEHFVPSIIPEAAFHRNTEETFLILGGGTAGLSAATAIRERNDTCKIVLVTREETSPYRRPMLTKILGGQITDLSIHRRDWYEAQNILLLTGRNVEALHPDMHQVTLTGGARLQYDKCIYALGAECFIPPIPGVNLPEAVAIRNLADIEKINGLLQNGTKTVIVVGGGVLGLEAAWSLRRAGCDVTVLERGGRIMARQLDAEAAEMLTDLCEAAGVRIRTGVETTQILGGDHVTGIRLGDGQTLDAGLVIVSSGVKPHTAVAKVAGADVGRAIRVNAYMETGLPDLYACGDCAEYEGMNAALWPVATEMGRVAGANAAGDFTQYQPVSLAVTFMGMQTRLYTDGDVGTDPAKQYTIQSERNDAKKALDKRYYLANRLCGVILIGDISKSKEYAQLLKG